MNWTREICYINSRSHLGINENVIKKNEDVIKKNENLIYNIYSRNSRDNILHK